MTALRQAAEEYLAMRRALGFKLTTQGAHLMSFVGYCEARGAGHITTELALAWATQTRRGSSDEVYQSRRLMVVRIFARHLQALDPATEIPPDDLLPHHYRRIAPYLYSPGEVTALMAAAGRLAPPLRAATWQTLIGLLAVTGMRKSEACHLDRNQVDLDAGSLVITDAKFGKARLLFLHPTAVTALRGYQRCRDRWCPGPAAPSFFVSTRGTRLDAHNIQRTFAALTADAGICAPPGRRRPRLHDLRHSFTVASLLDFYRDGGDVQARLPLLSTWLGHVDPKSTYWYLQAVPELLALAAGRLEQAFPFREPPA
jgi:integrase/recombinase XerD